jgi:hypothetical protein
VPQIQLALHRQLWMSELSFRVFLFLGHGEPPKRATGESTLVGSKSGDKRTGNLVRKLL